MGLHDVMTEVVGDKKATKKGEKHYIPFSREEFARLRVAFEKPDLMPNDVKLILLAIADKKFDIRKFAPTTKVA